ncbi:MAG TPA: methionyl-tRNA formyltransferase [Terriglobales bacterium]|nr:methionyl-tRNA formyltransferase [Terriglobales bacterium]
MSTSWRIVFMGTPDTAAFTLERLLEGPDSLVGVVTRPDRPAGRGQTLSPSPVRRTAERRSVPVITPEKIRDSGTIETLRAWSPDVIVVVAYGRILPAAILDLAPQGCVNVHYSLLPKCRGAAPAAWTIIHGEEKGGVTTMRLVQKMDAGPIFLQEEVPLAPDETTASLQAKLIPVGARLLLETIQRLKEGSLAGRPQDEAGVTFAPMIKKEDGLIDWSQSADAIERRVRGFHPWPSAYTRWQGKLLKIHRAKVIQLDTRGNPGEVVRAGTDGFWVATAKDALSLEWVQLENKKSLAGTEFIRGARVGEGDCLGA